jgi:FSR family fosmidomycin resistance protein-like MFS transporter
VSALELSSQELEGPATDYPRVALLSLGHLTNDLYGNLITAITPYLVLRGAISTTAAGLVLLIYLIGSSLLQPIIGATSDRTGRRYFAVFGPLWIGIAAGFTGWVGNAFVLLLLAALGGVGTAAFHPQAASMINRLSVRSRGWVMSIFSVGGNIGFAFGPLLAAGVATIGLRWSPVVILPGIGVTILLSRFAPAVAPRRVDTSALRISAIPRQVWSRLSAIVGVIALRSSVQYGLILFLPLYYHAHGSSAQLGSTFAFLVSLAGAAGGLVGGTLSDRYGRRPVVVSSLLVATPLLYGGLLIGSPAAWVLLPLSGAILLSSNSVTVVQGQELLPANTGMASGLTMGLGFGLSGLVGFMLAALAERVGVGTAILLVPALAPLAAVLAALAPHRSTAPSLFRAQTS